MKKGFICVVVATLMFSSMEVMLKFIVGELNVIQLSLIRFTLGGIFLLPMALNTLKKRGELDGNQDLMEFAERLERATIAVIEEGTMTKDLAVMTTIPNPHVAESGEFIHAIREKLEA